MKIKELIEYLKKYDGNLEVMTTDDIGCNYPLLKEDICDTYIKRGYIYIN